MIFSLDYGIRQMSPNLEILLDWISIFSRNVVLGYVS